MAISRWVRRVRFWQLTRSAACRFSSVRMAMIWMRTRVRCIARAMDADAADEFLRLYPVKTDADVAEAAHTAARENGMLKASRKCAQAQAGAAKSAAYISLFTHKHPYPAGLVLADQNPLTVGAYHTADVPYWFGTLDAFNIFRPTRVWGDYDRTLSAQMMRSLIAVASTGSPDTQELKWPTWSKRDERYLVFGDAIRAEKLAVKRMDWLAEHPPAPSAMSPAAG